MSYINVIYLTKTYLKGENSLTKNRLLKNLCTILKKKPIKNSHEMMPYWQAQNIKLETQKEQINR